MPDYRLHLRSRYLPDPSPGIQGGFANFEQSQDAARAEENQVRSQGGVLTHQAPSIFDRVKRFFRGDQDQDTDDGAPGGFDRAGDEQGMSSGPGGGWNEKLPGVQVTPQGTPTPYGTVAPPTRISDALNAPMPAGGSMSSATPPGSPGVARPPGSAMSPAARPSTNVSYNYETKGGNTYSIDPLRNQRASAALATETKEADVGRQVDALVSAGMPRGEAEARVRTNTVRYDEDFGAPRSQLTFAQRQQLQKQRDDAAYQRALLAAKGQTDSEEYRRLGIAMQQASLALQMAGFRATGFENTANEADKGVPKDPIARQIAESQPGGAAKIAAAESTRDANRDSAARTRNEGAEAAAGVVAGTKKFTQQQFTDRVQQLNKAGYSREEIYRIMKNEGYPVERPKQAVPPTRSDSPPRPPRDTGNINLSRP